MPARRAVIVCANLAVDRTLHVPSLPRGGVVRAVDVQAVPGGKGANAARVAAALGAEVRLVGFVGHGGDVIRDGLESRGVETDLVVVAGETRQTVALVEPDGVVTLVNEPGPRVDAADCARLAAAAAADVRPGDVVLLTGSLPPGAPAALLRDIAAALPAVDVVVD